MLDRFSELIDPLLFAERKREIKGEIELCRLSRLIEILADEKGQVRFTLSFGKEAGLAWIHGDVAADLGLLCQNCLEILPWPVSSNVKLGIISSIDEVDLLPRGYEPLLLGEKKITLTDIVEDELLLSIPAFPKHDTNCYKLGIGVNSQQSEKSNSNNPFSVLTKLKKNGDT